MYIKIKYYFTSVPTSSVVITLHSCLFTSKVVVLVVTGRTDVFNGISDPNLQSTVVHLLSHSPFIYVTSYGEEVLYTDTSPRLLIPS